MSDNSETPPPDTSLLSNLKNKVTFNLHQATYDPKANEFAQQKAQKQKELDDAKKQQEQANTTDDTNNQGDPNKFSGKRLITKVGNQTLDIFKKIFFPFLSLMLAMIVTNEMIVYSAPIRLIFFIFTFLICFFFQYTAVILGIYYLLRGGYSYYVNNMTDKPKSDIMPTIFALLPITTYKPLSSLGTFFMYPFTYPKTELGAIKLPEIMKNYWQSLEGSFVGLDKVKNLPIFADGMKKIKKDLDHLHDMKQSNSTSEDKPVNSNNQISIPSAAANTNEVVAPASSAPSNNNPSSV